MNINISLIGQMVTFGILIWVTMRYVWPPLIAAVDKRNKEIAEGLDAAEQGRRQLAEAQAQKDEMLAEGRARQGEYVAEGRRRREQLIEAAAGEAGAERERIIAEGHRAVEQERAAMVRELQAGYAELVVAGVGRILAREVDQKAHQDIVDEMVNKGI